MLLLLSLVCGVLIIVAFGLQLWLAG